MTFSDNDNFNNKMDVFDRSSFFTRRDSIRNSLMSRGLSFLLRSSKIFTEEEENDLLRSCQSFADEQLAEELITPSVFFHQESSGLEVEPVSSQPPIPQPVPVINRVVSAPPSLPSSWQPSQELDESSCSSSTSGCVTQSTSCSQSSSTLVHEPGQWDIICGRNSRGFQCVGNRRFRVTVLMNMNRYLEAPTRDQKTQVIKSIVRTLKNDVGARFLLKVNKNEYRVLNDKEVRNKVAHTMRDMVQEQKKNDGHFALEVSPKLVGSPLQSRRKFQRITTARSIDAVLDMHE